MAKILVVENNTRDADRFRELLVQEDLEIAICRSGAEAEEMMASDGRDEFAAAIILWEIPGPPFGFALLTNWRQDWPAKPAVIVSGTLDATLATRAAILGANDFLEKPLEAERVKSCLRSLLAPHETLSPLLSALQETIIGKSPELLSALRKTARLIPHVNSRALLIGESGTGKELFAKAIHQLGPTAGAPLVAINVAAIPKDLAESTLFGHEKGAFTGAINQRLGALEEAEGGTLFLDEIGELDLSLQVKLLRAIQEREFRRIGGSRDLTFEARLVCATNRDLAQEVRKGAFRQDLYHRIAEKTIQIPPLRERTGDIEILLHHFLEIYRGGRPIRFARETLSIFRSYRFPGNVRELQYLVRGALIDCEGDEILPKHLPLEKMDAQLLGNENPPPANPGETHSPLSADRNTQELLEEITKSLPQSWVSLPYREAALHSERAFDRIYLRHLHARVRGNVTRAAQTAGIDTKTFRKRWKESGLAPLNGPDEDET
ncbi:MAG: sigma-54 dependent transcriptional regulator [Blastocatellia bacterium]|nr:sigma-54 dependent transcriptional regulator [Blastocatellia bacterium]